MDTERNLEISRLQKFAKNEFAKEKGSTIRRDTFRNSKSPKSILGWKVWLIVILASSLIGSLTYLSIYLERGRKDLELRGVGAIGVVRKKWTDTSYAGNWSHLRRSYMVSYNFSTSSGKYYYADFQEVSKQQYDGLRIGSRVPVVYDPQETDVHALNFDGEVRREPQQGLPPSTINAR